MKRKEKKFIYTAVAMTAFICLAGILFIPAENVSYKTLMAKNTITAGIEYSAGYSEEDNPTYVIVNGNLEITAEATDAVIVYFNANTKTGEESYGSVTESSIECPIGDPLGDLPSASYKNYTFAGWFDADGKEYTEKSVLPDDTGTEFNLYAHWVKSLVVQNTTQKFNNEEQEPSFFSGDIFASSEDTDYSSDPSDYFTWTVCPSDDLTCTSTTAKDVLYSTDDDGYDYIDHYIVSISVKDDADVAGDYPIYLQVISGGSDNGASVSFVKSTSVNFTITPFELGDDNTEITLSNEYYTADDVMPTSVVVADINGNKVTLVKDTDYSLSANAGIYDAGDYEITVNGKGNYGGSVTENWTLETRDVGEAVIDYTDRYYWTGSAIEPKVAISYNGVLLEEGTDYTLSYNNNISVGTAQINITGTGTNFSGEITKEFEIVANENHVTETDGYAVYSGTATNGGAGISVIAFINEVPVTDYVVEYGTVSGTYDLTDIPLYTDAGVYTVYYRVTHPGLETVTGDLRIVIAKAQNTISLTENTFVLNHPEAANVEYTLGFDTDISISSSNYVTVSATGGKTGTINMSTVATGTETITVTAEATDNLEAASAELFVTVKPGKIKVSVNNETVTYDKNPHSLTLNSEPSDANIIYTWENNGMTETASAMPSFTDAGYYIISYSITRENFDDYFGNNSLQIDPKDIGSSDITIEVESGTWEYNGGAKHPGVTVKDGEDVLVKGTDYTVKYKNNILPGTSAEIVISGIGNYSGSVSRYFEIESGSIIYSVTNGTAEYTGYNTYGADTDTTDKAYVDVVSPSAYTIRYSLDGSEYLLTSMPKFKNVGTHTVYFRIFSAGYEDVYDTLTITISKKTLKAPTAFGEYIYTGLIQSPTWLNYNSKFMLMTGDLKATTSGLYSVTVSLTDSANTEWEDGSTSDKTAEWEIKDLSVSEHEQVVEGEIAYNERKQLFIQDGKTTFERTGYEQIAWIESCEDTPDTNGKDIRTCNYSRYVTVDDSAHLNYFDTGSSVSGTYVAEQVDYDSSETYNLYAVWSTITYKINYNLCDAKGCGELKDNPPTIVSYDYTFSVRNPERTGYLFAGWEVSGMDNTPHMIGVETTSETEFTVPEEWVGLTQEEKLNNVSVTFRNLTSMQDTTVTLNAVWIPINYKIEFVGNKETFTDENGVVTTAELTGDTYAMYPVTYDMAEPLTSNGFELTGYTFDSWNTEPDGSGTRFEDGANVLNLTTIEGDTVKLYAQWDGNSDTPFTITYWKQNIGKGTEHNAVNYQRVGSETYYGKTDRNVIITPYSYKGVSASESVSSDGLITSTSTKPASTGNAEITSSASTGYTSATNANLSDTYFYGFTPETEGDDSTVTGTYTYTVLPDGSRNIDIYYTRNVYFIVYMMNGGTATNPDTRQYQVKVTFTDPSDGSLLDGVDDYHSSTANTGEADFAGWFRNPDVTIEVTGIDGEVTTDETVYAKWLQYRYSGYDGYEEAWSKWGKESE